MKSLFTTYQNIKRQEQKGFTLIETIIAIFILSVTVGALLQIAAQGFYTVRYLRNQIVANNLLQEGIEFIRNTRDSEVLAKENGTWDAWITTMRDQGGCFQETGCIVDPYVRHTQGVFQPIMPCVDACTPFSFFEETGFYGYETNASGYPTDIASGTSYPTSYIRTITMKMLNDEPSVANQVIVTVTVVWENGDAAQKVSQSILLTKW